MVYNIEVSLYASITFPDSYDQGSKVRSPEFALFILEVSKI